MSILIQRYVFQVYQKTSRFRIKVAVNLAESSEFHRLGRWLSVWKVFPRVATPRIEGSTLQPEPVQILSLRVWDTFTFCFGFYNSCTS